MNDNSKDEIDNFFKELKERDMLAEVLTATDSLKKLMQKKKLNIYLGIDPTGESLHLGHIQNIIVLEMFRRLGHNVILLFGTFTAMIGDPSGKSKARQQLSKKDINRNVKKLKKQCGGILKTSGFFNKAKVKYNYDWLSKLSSAKIIEILSNFTVQHSIQRDMFEKRMKDGVPIYMHELLYPTMQGYDSVAMDIDLEIGGTDQTFSILAGRTLVKRYLNKEKFLLTTNLIANPSTGVLMSKSNGTGVMIGGSPEDLFGQVMAQPDEMTEVLFKRATFVPLKEIKEILTKNKKEAKEALAYEIVKLIHNEKEAKKAKRCFDNQFSQKKTPENIDKIKIKSSNIIDVLVEAKLVASKSEGKRKVAEGGVYVDGEKVLDIALNISTKEKKVVIIRLGRRFVSVCI